MPTIEPKYRLANKTNINTNNSVPDMADGNVNDLATATGVATNSSIGITALAPATSNTEVDETVTFVGKIVAATPLTAKIGSALGWQPSYSDFFARPVRIWQNVDTAVPASTFVLSDWMASTAVASKLANYQGVRGTMCVRIQHNGNPYRLGKRIWVLDMQLNNDPVNQVPLDRVLGADGNGIPFQTLSTYPIKGYTLPWTSETLDLKIPYLYNLDFYPKTTTVGPILHARSIVPTYNTNGSAITNPISFTLYAWMENIELVRSSRTQSNTENSYRKISGAVGMASDAAKSFGFSTTPVDIAKKFGDKVATALGYSKPTMRLNTNMLQPYGLSPMSTFNADSAEIVNANAWENEEPVDAASLGFGSDDDTSIVKIGAVPGIISVVSMSNPLIDSVIFTDHVRPRGSESGIYKYPTPAAWIALAHNWWRGDVVYHFDIVASPFVKGVVRIEFDPYAFALPALGTIVTPSTNMVQTLIIDLNSETSGTIRCPWNNRMRAAARTDPFTSTVGNPANNANGVITALMSAPFMVADNVAPVINMVVWQSIENLEVFEYDQRNHNAFTPAWNRAQSNTCDGFGEHITSINQLTRIFTNGYIRGSVVGATGDFYQVTANVPTFPPAIYAAAGANNAPNANFTDAGVRTYGLVYWSSGFLARRGGSRIKFICGLTELDSRNGIVTTNRTNTTIIPTFAINRGTVDPSLQDRLGTINIPKSLDGALYAEVRNNRRSPLPFLDARQFGSGAAVGGWHSYGVRYDARFRLIGTPTMPGYMGLAYAGDDNYTLNMFWGSPILTAI